MPTFVFCVRIVLIVSAERTGTVLFSTTILKPTVSEAIRRAHAYNISIWYLMIESSNFRKKILSRKICFFLKTNYPKNSIPRKISISWKISIPRNLDLPINLISRKTRFLETCDFPKKSISKTFPENLPRHILNRRRGPFQRHTFSLAYWQR